jgi:demethylmenaquinone methyltransferase/2-methoxy-6-polyprenyl-1,4-benzoquinol methylase
MDLTGADRAKYVQEMFARIAPRYDLMNRIMTGGQDLRWRAEVIRRAGSLSGGLLLDLGAGTGDLGREALRQQPTCKVVAVDFTLEMMQIGRLRSIRRGETMAEVDWSTADAHRLPFPDNTFTAAVSGFLLRNVNDVGGCLGEQLRVLKPEGRIVALDTTPPAVGPLNSLIRLYLHEVIPLLGRFIAGQAQAYRYLPDSTEGFLSPEQLARRLVEAGFEAVGFRHFMFGVVAIHWGVKPAASEGRGKFR